MDWTSIILILVVAFFIFVMLLVIAAALAFYFGRKEMQKRLYKFLKPDARDVQKDIQRLALKYPHMSVDEVAAAYVKEQGKFLALIGLLTEIPILGFVLDLSFTTLRQMRMLHVITALYSNQRLDSEELEIKSMALVGGANLLGRSVLKLITSSIPLLNGLLNAGLNWWITNRIGEMGIGWNKEQSWRETLGNKAREVQGKLSAATQTAVNAAHFRQKAKEPAKPLTTEEQLLPPNQ